MKDEKLKYRLSYFRTPEAIPLFLESFSEDQISEIPDNYFYNTRSINLESGKVEEKTYILVVPVRKFRKNETIIDLSDKVDLGLDDY